MRAKSPSFRLEEMKEKGRDVSEENGVYILKDEVGEQLGVREICLFPLVEMVDEMTGL